MKGLQEHISYLHHVINPIYTTKHDIYTIWDKVSIYILKLLHAIQNFYCNISKLCIMKSIIDKRDGHVVDSKAVALACIWSMAWLTNAN